LQALRMAGQLDEGGELWGLAQALLQDSSRPVGRDQAQLQRGKPHW
jgi:hypothetical protein